MVQTQKFERLSITPAQCRGARAMLGWTQGQLARSSGVTRPTVAYFEADKRDPPTDPLSRIKYALEIGGIIFVGEDSEGPGVRLRKSKA